MRSLVQSPAEFAGLAWERPLGLLALALPLALLFLHRARARPEPTATGTLALWREVLGARSTRDAHARRSVPPRLWILLAALCAGSVALAGPRPARAAPNRVWRVVVDRSPSMHLPWSAEEGDGAPLASSITRLAAALARLEPFLAEIRGAGSSVLWIAHGPEGAVTSASDRPPDAWLAAPDPPWPEPDWERIDEAGVVWLTDREPSTARERAGLCASGGAAVPGLVGRDRDGLVEWDGEQLVDSPRSASASVCALDRAGALPDEIASLFEIWAEQRGVEVVDASGSSAFGAGAFELELRAVDGELAPEPLAAARDGWSLRARSVLDGAPRSDARGPLAAWLVASDGRALVAAGFGRVLVALRSIDELEGDPVAFALSFAALFDASRLPPAGSVSVTERVSAGDGGFAPAREGPRPEGSNDPPFPLAAWLAVAAFALALAATWNA